MADKKITQLDPITGANLADTDEFVVVDLSADETKSITFAELKNGFDTGTGFVRITGDTMTGNLSFGDSNKIIMGAGSDLQLYHDGSNSYVDDAGTGRLYLRGNDRVQIQKYTGEDMITAIADGAVNIYYDNAKKFETTSTGIDVTGTAVTDGLTVAGAAAIGANATKVNFYSDSTYSGIYNGSSLASDEAIYMGGDAMFFYAAGKQRLNINAGGDISFYEDTGTTAKLFWDASAESLGIGTNSPDAPLHVEGASGTQLVVEASSGNFAQMDFKIGGTQKGAIWTYEATDLMGFFAPSGWGQNFYTNGTETMRLTSSGNVGIGDSSPSRALSTKSSSVTVGSFESTSASGGLISFVDPNTTNDVTVRVGSLGNNLVFQAGGSERMRIDSSGRLLVAKTTTAFGTVGHTIWNDGSHDLTASAIPPIQANRLTSDGDIIAFYKTSSKVGSIGNSGTNFIIQQSNSSGVIQLKNHDNTEDIEFGQDYFRIKQGGAQRMYMDSAGVTTFSTKVSVTAADGVRDADYVATFQNQEATSGRNFGVSIAGGTSGSDIALNVVNGAANTALLRVHGDGTTSIGTTLTFGGKVNVHEGGIGIGEGSSAGSYRRMYWNASNNEMRFWNGTNEARITDGGAFTDASDVSLKKDIAEIEYGIDTVKALKPRKYKMKDTGAEQVGFIAQEMETQVPEVVSTGVTPDGDEQKGISYGQLTAVLTKAIQEQQTVIEALTARITALEGA